MTLRKRKRKLMRLFERQQGRCYLCDQPMTLAKGEPHTATIEHRLPRSRFGPPADRRSAHDVAAACQRCNVAKGNLTEAEYRAGFADARHTKRFGHPFARDPTLRRLCRAMQDAVDAYGDGGAR